MNIYFIGIKGVGMTALAQIYLSRGHKVWGSDVAEVFPTDRVLERNNIPILEGFDELHITNDIDLVVATNAFFNEHIDLHNVEIQKVQQLGLNLLTYSHALGQLSKEFYSIGVAGSHGKTTTSGLLGFVMNSLGLNPYALVGGTVPQFLPKKNNNNKSDDLGLGSNALIGNPDSTYFVAEVDDYQNHFHYFYPQATIITNVEYDHPDFFKSTEQYIQSFVTYIQRIPQDGILVWCYDDPLLQTIMTQNQFNIRTIISYSLANDHRSDNKADFVLKNDHIITKQGLELGHLKELFLVGSHNSANALGVFVLLYNLGQKADQIIQALAQFKGVGRRFELKGITSQGALVIDDYAHHPTEIQVTLKAARQRFNHKKLWCVFHPHTFSRTQELFHDFKKSFKDCDYLIILDIYGSAREEQGTIHSSTLVQEIAQYNRDNSIVQEVTYIGLKEEVVLYLKNRLGLNDVLITMGAGDVWKLGTAMVE